MIRAASVVGLGNVGAPLAACLASRGIRTLGYDIDSTKTTAIAEGRPPVDEPGLAELIRPPLRATDDLGEAIRQTDVTFVTVPTPSAADGGVSAERLRAAVAAITGVLESKTSPHVVAVTTTVMPGTVATLAPPPPHTIAYVPVFFALGTAIRDCLAPDLVLIGTEDGPTAECLRELHARFCTNTPAVHVTALAEAELAKLALNAYLATKISFANTLGMISDALGCDVTAVTGVVGSDRRVGPGFLRAGMSFGGGCLPRDTRALAVAADAAGVRADLLSAALEVNDRALDEIARRVGVRLPPHGVAGVCGLAFKAGTSVLDASPGVALARRLSRDCEVVAYDPLVRDGAAAGLGFDVTATLEECLERADVVVLASDAEELRGVRHPAVVDPWRRR
jgi:UDPglucose 6-dehydrogenase